MAKIKDILNRGKKRRLIKDILSPSSSNLSQNKISHVETLTQDNQPEKKLPFGVAEEVGIEGDLSDVQRQELEDEINLQILDNPSFDFNGLSEEKVSQLKQEKERRENAYKNPFFGLSVPQIAEEMVTGERRETVFTRELDQWDFMPEVNSLKSAVDPKAWKTMAATMFSSPEEAVKIITTQFPNVEVRRDRKGNFLFRSGMGDRKWYVNKPGFGWTDAPTAATAAALGTIGSKSGPLAAVVAGAGTEAGIETLQSQVGGDFDPEMLILGAGAGAVGEGMSRGTSAMAKAMGRSLSKAGRYLSPAIKGFKRKIPLVRTMDDLSKAAPIEKTPQQLNEADARVHVLLKEAMESDEGKKRLADSLNDPDIIDALDRMGFKTTDSENTISSMRESVGSDFSKAASSKGKARQIAKDLPVDDSVVAAAKENDDLKFLDPDHVTSDFAYQEMAQLLKSIKGSEARAQEVFKLKEMGKKYFDWFEKLGASPDTGGMSEKIKSGMSDIVAKYENKANKLYSKINRMMPADTMANTNSLSGYFNEISKGFPTFPDNLEGLHKKIYNRLSSNKPLTYAEIDDFRKQVGAKIGRLDNFDAEELRKFGKLYGRLTKDQETTLMQKSPTLFPSWEEAKGYVRIKKAHEDEMKHLFGKNLDGQIVNKLISSNAALTKTDATKLNRMLKAIPEKYRQEVVLNSIFKTFDSGKNIEDGVLNYTKFSDFWRNMSKSSQGRNLIGKHLPKGAMKRLDNLGKLTQAIADARKKYVGNGASLQAFFEPTDSLFKVLLKGTGNTAVATVAGSTMGNSGMLTALVLGAGGTARGAMKSMRGEMSDQVDRLIASPEFIDFVTKRGADIDALREAEKLAKSKTFLGVIKGMPDQAPGGLREMILQAPVRWLMDTTRKKKVQNVDPFVQVQNTQHEVSPSLLDLEGMKDSEQYKEILERRTK